MKVCSKNIKIYKDVNFVHKMYNKFYKQIK